MSTSRGESARSALSKFNRKRRSAIELVKFAVVGIGGFGRSHLASVADMETQGLGRLDAAVVIDPENHPGKLEEFRQKGVRIYAALDDLLAAGGVDVISLPVGIHHHAPLSVACLDAGFNVISEKPMTSVAQEADRMIAARERAGKFLIIGYQHLYSRSIQTIRARLQEGRLGRIRSVRLKAGWPRPDSYYGRNAWAGRLKTGDLWVLDSPINNALAHYVNNALYLCGPSRKESCSLRSVQAELYRARADIESLDTACLRATTSDGIPITVVMSHATRDMFGPQMDIFCENGTVSWNRVSTAITCAGSAEEFPESDNTYLRTLPFKNAIETLRGQAEVLSTPEIARVHTLCINGAHESCPDIATLPQDAVEAVRSPSGDRFLVLNGLDDLIHRSAEEEKLFSELGVAWARPTQPFDLEGYACYPGGNAYPR